MLLFLEIFFVLAFQSVINCHLAQMVADAKYQIFPHKTAKIQKHEEINLMHKGLHQKKGIVCQIIFCPSLTNCGLHGDHIFLGEVPEIM